MADKELNGAQIVIRCLQEEGVEYVFGLPGNPVSAMVTFELFVRPAIRESFVKLDPCHLWRNPVMLIVEIGAVELFNHVATGKTFHVYINPEREVDRGTRIRQRDPELVRVECAVRRLEDRSARRLRCQVS